MKRLFHPLLILCAPATAMAQAVPSPSLDDPRLQTLSYDSSRTTRLVAFPELNLTVVLMPGDQIEQVTTSDHTAFEVRITDSGDSLNIMALRADASAKLIVATRQRRYEFDVATRGGMAAYLVRFLPGAPPSSMPPLMSARPNAPVVTRRYRLSGERALIPTGMSDDGQRTYVEWGEHQSLPAVFGIGPTGQEEVVDGYMRDGKFTIDRVYGELIFRMDKKQAKARRLEARSAG